MSVLVFWDIFTDIDRKGMRICLDTTYTSSVRRRNDDNERCVKLRVEILDKL